LPLVAIFGYNIHEVQGFVLQFIIVELRNAAVIMFNVSQSLLMIHMLEAFQENVIYHLTMSNNDF